MRRWTPHITVATVIEKQGRYLLVEERDKVSGAMVFNQPKTLAVAEFMESGNLASLRHCQQVLDKINHQWPKDLDNSGYWLFKPQHISIKRSQQNTGIQLLTVDVYL